MVFKWQGQDRRWGLTLTLKSVCLLCMLKSKYFQNFVEYLNYPEVGLANSQFVKEESPYILLAIWSFCLLFSEWEAEGMKSQPCVLYSVSVCVATFPSKALASWFSICCIHMKKTECGSRRMASHRGPHPDPQNLCLCQCLWPGNPDGQTADTKIGKWL